jgi:uncharacterized membrane protein YhaH (DUF805 family)
MRLGPLSAFWWTLHGRVSRRTYLVCGLALALLKYAGDVGIVLAMAGRWWTPLGYLQPARAMVASGADPTLSTLFLPLLALWTIPFLWIGVTLTVRRAVDAGWSAWFVLLFFVPYLNYVLMAALCIAPTAPGGPHPVEVGGGPAQDPARRAKLIAQGAPAVAAALVVGLTMFVVAIEYRGQYGVPLFFGAPFAMGMMASFLFNRNPATAVETLVVVLITIAVAAIALIAFAREGAICIAMALPLVTIVAVVGGIIGRTIAGGRRSDLRPSLLGVIVLPLWVVVQPAASTGALLHVVVSTVEIQASPDRVWQHVVAFSPIAEPDELIFRAGVAYPKEARIEGAGVGAVRYCEFSTGAFVEPTTVWEPGRRLAFDVADSPPPMRELTPYGRITPPHLDGYLHTIRGEFRLIPLAAGGTRLEGRTWYRLDMGPEAYWLLLTDALIHRIHLRVLEHIKREAEAAGRGPGGS